MNVLVYAAAAGPRLRYVLDWLLGERLQLSYTLSSDKGEAVQHPYCIAYGCTDLAVSIYQTSLLDEVGISQPTLSYCQNWNGLFTLFHQDDSTHRIPFDLFSAIFYLLSRYEEYQKFEPDQHGRFPGATSLLYQLGVLDRPIVDEWVLAFRSILEQTWGVRLPTQRFRYQPSYDIDIAWSYRHKGWARSLGGALKDIITGKLQQVQQRIRVLKGKEDDPYDSYDWLTLLHERLKLEPIWFYLAALRPGKFDKNSSPQARPMIQLIQKLAVGDNTGMHPSYHSTEQPSLLEGEKKQLERILKRPISKSRQHFIRLQFPSTFQTLLRNDIQDDYSLGFPDQIGFRAGTGSPFFWYDLSQEVSTRLRLHPFVFMDTTAHFYLGLTPKVAFEKLVEITNRLIALQSTLVTVMHNFSLGTDETWQGWRPEYERFLEQMIDQSATTAKVD
ncbi:MAG: polysaccharide deacetylase family protein [Bacteroidetes bacterium]|nr:polysaccharide deacetylase family protein [Bacteroidota bacterium]